MTEEETERVSDTKQKGGRRWSTMMMPHDTQISRRNLQSDTANHQVSIGPFSSPSVSSRRRRSMPALREEVVPFERLARETRQSIRLLGSNPEFGRFQADLNPFQVHRRPSRRSSQWSVSEVFGTVAHSEEYDIQLEEQGSTESIPETQFEEQGTTESIPDEVETESLVTVIIEWIKCIYSTALLVFCLILVMATIFSEQTNGTADLGLHPVIAFFVFWFLITWLATMEGGQGALVGLQPIGKNLYANSHPWAWKNTNIAHRGDNMERFIVGRQFLVVLVVFVTNMVASATADADVLGLPPAVIEIFLNNGIALMLCTIIIGQLTAQVNAASCMLDFINNYYMLFTTYVSLMIEFSGLLHSVYLVPMLFSKITGNAVQLSEPTRNTQQKLFFWARVSMSLVILGFAFAVTLTALFDGNTAMWEGVPPAVSVVVFFVLMCFVGMMEGMQIALFAVINMPEEELEHHTIAVKNCQLAFTGQNLQAFLIGRQICVTVCMFVVARITQIEIEVGVDDNVFGVSDGLQEFFNLGLLGAVITTIVGSLAWRIIASSLPLAFLSNPLIYLIIRLCLFLEASGVCSAAWVLGSFHRWAARLQPDEVYLEGAEEKATNEKATKHQKGDYFRFWNFL